MTPTEKESAARRLWPPGLTAAVLVAAVLTAALVTAGCETTVDVELPDHEPRLVVNELFTADSLWRVSVTESRSIEEVGPAGRFPPVENATVEILDGDGRLLGTLAYDEERRVYRSRSSGLGRPEAGRTYAVRVSAPGFETAEATSRTPAPVPLHLRQDRTPSVSPVIEFTIPDPDGQANYYALSVYERFFRNGVLVGTTRRSFSSTSPLLRENVQRAFFEEGPGDDVRTRYQRALFSDTAFRGETRRMKIRVGIREGCCFNDEEVQRRQFIVLTSLSEASYEYQRTVALAERTGENPFAEPVKIHSNVRGGLGVFAGGTSVKRPLPDGG